MKKEESLSYLGYNENNEWAGIVFRTGKGCNTSILFNFRNKRKILPMSNSLINKYSFIEKIDSFMKNRGKQTINNTVKEYYSFRFKFYPVSLSYLNDQYILSIQLPDSTFRFVIYNIEELLSSLKEGIIFPGDKFIGIEAIKLLDKRNKEWYWKAKCLLCGREFEIRGNKIKNQESCGCILGKGFDSLKERFMFNVDKQENILKEQQIRGTLGIDEEPCWLWTGSKSNRGYGKLEVETKTKIASRVSFEIFNDKQLPSNIFVCHRCDNPICVNPNHLFEGTHRDNTDDMLNKNRSFKPNHKGENHNQRKLSLKDVLYIRSIKNITSKIIKNLSHTHNVTRQCIYSILKNVSWKKEEK